MQLQLHPRVYPLSYVLSTDKGLCVGFIHFLTVQSTWNACVCVCVCLGSFHAVCLCMLTVLLQLATNDYLRDIEGRTESKARGTGCRNEGQSVEE